MKRKLKYPDLAADALVAPLAASAVLLMDPKDLRVHPALQVRGMPIDETGVVRSIESEGTYDVDKGGVLVGWLPLQPVEALPSTYYGPSCCEPIPIYVVDGHHRRVRAATAKHFVTSVLDAGNQVPVSRQIPVRVLYESDGWTLDLVQAQARKMNGLPNDQDAANDSLSDALAATTDSWQILATDGVKGGLMRVRQRAMRVDSRNKNRRMYPRKVVDQALVDARPRATAGAMLSEYEHPDFSTDKRDGEQKYFDNPENKSARVDEIEEIDASGWVWIKRTVLDTDRGRALKSRFDAGNPPGLSTRFKMRGHTAEVDGVRLQVADTMDIFTWDDVENPAVDGAGAYELLADNVLRQIQAGEGERDRNAHWEINPMNEHIKAKRDALSALIKSKAGTDAIRAARADLQASVDAAITLGADANELRKLAAEADAEMEGSGYRADKPTAKLEDQNLTAGQGYAPDVAASSPKEPVSSGSPSVDAETLEWVKNKRAQEESEQAAKAKSDAVEAALATDSVKESLSKLPDHLRQRTVDTIKLMGVDSSKIQAFVDAQVEGYSKVMADAKLQGMGFVGGQTTSDPASPAVRTSVKTGAMPWMETVDRLCAAADDYALTAGSDYDSPSTERESRRQYNKEHIVQPLMNAMAMKYGAASADSWMVGADAQEQELRRILNPANQMAGDSTTTSQLLNQPSILMFIMTQMFQDLRALQFVAPLGRGFEGGSEFIDRGYGTVVRIPVEYWAEPSGYGATGYYFDEGLLTPEGTGIDEGSVNVAWLEYATALRQIAFSVTARSMLTAGNGPLNYNAIARNMIHAARREGRTIDRALMAEIAHTSDEYGAVAVADETVTDGNNSVMPAAGLVTVNLNPAKVASAAVAAGDQYVTYGANVKAAIRLQGPSAGAASPYFGTAYGPSPIVRPRVNTTLSATGTASTTTANPISITAPANMVEGRLTDDKQITAKASVANPTYAVDYENAVIVFNAAAGLHKDGGGNYTDTVVTIHAYSYATNFDNFSLTVPAGVVAEEYYRGLLSQVNATAAMMGSYGRFIRPDLLLGSLVASTYVENSAIFDRLRSPKGTDLYPTEDFYAERSGIGFARFNTPWPFRDRRLQLTRRFATKLGIDQPLEFFGPQFKTDSNGNAIAGQLYYGQSQQVICTPQVQKQDGTILNPVSRSIILRGNW